MDAKRPTDSGRISRQPLLYAAICSCFLMLALACSGPPGINEVATDMQQADTSEPQSDTTPGLDTLEQPEGDSFVGESPDESTADATVPTTAKILPHLERRDVKDAQQRLAICNNGADYVYHIRRGVGSGARKWIIHLKGGGSCVNKADCKKRGPSFTDPQTAQTLKKTGILSPDSNRNPGFYNWNHVYMYYCSSDLWTGDRPASVDTAGLHFRGARIFIAVIEDLQNPELTASPRLDQSTEVLLTGSSAGGGGVANNLNRLVALLPESVKVSGIVDSAYAPRIEPFAISPDYAMTSTANRLLFWNIMADPVCLAATGDASVCYGTYNLMPYHSMPVFFYYDQADSNKLPKIGITDLNDPEQRDYVLNTFAPAVRQQLESTTEACFSTFVGVHTALVSDRFFTMKVDGLSYSDLVANWYFKTGGPVKVIATKPQKQP